MKSLFLFSISIFIGFLGMAQVPYLINYQAVALNNNGSTIAGQSIAVRISLHENTANGTVLYTETRQVTTDASGLFDVQIGSSGATNVSGDLASITQSDQPKYLQVEMDAAGGSNFTDMGTQRLASVPYALVSEKSGSAVTAEQLILPYSATDNNPASFRITNTVSGGTAIWGKATSTNPSSSGIVGEGAGGSSVGVRATNTNGFAIFASAAPTGSSNPVIYGFNYGTSGAGIKGKSDGASGYGVYGESVAGTGVSGYGNNAGSIGVYGNSLAGTGVKAYSFSGTALEVSGNLKIAGGNTNPSSGAVLTSDASGNAVWKNNKVAFKAYIPGNQNIPYWSNTVPNMTESHDLGNNFNTSSAASNPNTFIAPVAGVYHFDGFTYYYYSSSIYNINQTVIKFTVNGSSSGIEHNTFSTFNGTGSSICYQDCGEDFHLNAGDKVQFVLRQSNGGNVAIPLYQAVFSGHLVVAD